MKFPPFKHLRPFSSGVIAGLPLTPTDLRTVKALTFGGSTCRPDTSHKVGVNGRITSVLTPLFLAVLFVAFLQNPQPAPAAEPVTVDFWIFQDFLTGDAGTLIKQFATEFETTNPGIKVHLIGKSAPDILSGVVMGAGSGALPDVITTQYAFAGSLVTAGLIKDVSSNWGTMPSSWQKQYSPWAVKVLTHDKQMFGIPLTGYATVLYRNLTVLKKAGIDPAVGIKDWSDWLAQSKKIKDSGYFASAKYFDDYWAQLNFYGGVKGAQFGLTPDGKSLTMEAAKYADALGFMKVLQAYSSDVSYADQAATDLFVTNKMAFMVNGPFKNPAFEEAKKENGLDYDYILIPGQTADTRGGVFGGEFLAVLNTPKSDAAWKWASFLADSAQMKRFAARLGRYVSNDIVLADPEIKANTLLQLTAKAFDSAVPESPFMVELPEQFFQPMTDNGDLVMFSKESPQEGAKNAIGQMNQSLQNN